ncbi:MAG TPA: polysaccharide biosynthesis tyrosine autokinase [Oscillatoriaceae cyanobacterium]
MDLKFYLAVLYRRWWIILTSTVLVAAFSFLHARKAPVSYTAQARLLYQENTLASSVLGQMYMPMSWNNPVDTQLQLITTRPNVQEVIDRLRKSHPQLANRLQPDAILGGLSADVDKNTDVILLRYVCGDPTEAVQVVNTMANVFVERDRSYQQEAAHDTRMFIEKELAHTEAMLNQAEDAMAQFRLKNNVFEVSALGNQTSGALSGIDTDLMTLQLDRNVAQSQLDDALKHLQLTNPEVIQRMEQLRSDEVYTALQKQVAGDEAALTVAKTQYTADAPEVKDAQARLDRLTAAVEQRVRIVLGHGVDQQDLVSSETPSEQRYTDQLIKAQSELDDLAAREKALKANQGTYEQRFQTLPAKDQEYSALQRRVQAAEDAYNVFFKRDQEMRISEAMDMGDVRVIEQAAGAAASASGLQRTVMLAALMGLVFGLGIALLIEFLDDRIRRPEEAQNVLELPILGLLPWVDSRDPRRRLVVLDDPRSPVTESYRALQTYTRMVEPETRQQCFLLTSPGPKEGKSTVLANLAVTSAQLGKRTLIVDTDLRAPCQHINFDRPNLMGIYDVVYEDMPVHEVIQETDVPNLDLLATGPVPPDPVQTLHAEGFRRMVERLCGEYDAIFFDSPPINLFTDAAVLGRMVDTVLLVVDVRSTTRQNTVTAKELLIKARVPLAGMVVKNTTHQATRYHNRYYERYYMDRLKNMAED